MILSSLSANCKYSSGTFSRQTAVPVKSAKVIEVSIQTQYTFLVFVSFYVILRLICEGEVILMVPVSLF